jgi:hypothetical protein
MVKEELKVRVPNPHQAGDISESLLHEILRQAGISKGRMEKGVILGPDSSQWGSASASI